MPSGSRVTSYVRNRRGNPLRVVHPDGVAESFVWNGSGARVVEHVDRAGRTDVYKWILGHPLHAGRVVEGVTNRLWSVAYDPQLNVVSVGDPLGRAAETYALDENIEAFALTVCRNMALDRLRLHENQNASLDDTPVESNPTATANPYERTVQREKVQIVRQLIDALPEKQRACMQLRDMEGKTHKEIAAVLGITEEQVRVNIFRARQTIKQQFERYENYGLN